MDLNLVKYSLYPPIRPRAELNPFDSADADPPTCLRRLVSIHPRVPANSPTPFPFHFSPFSFRKYSPPRLRPSLAPPAGPASDSESPTDGYKLPAPPSEAPLHDPIFFYSPLLPGLIILASDPPNSAILHAAFPESRARSLAFAATRG